MDYLNANQKTSSSLVIDDSTPTPKDHSRGGNDITHLSSHSSLAPSMNKHNTEL